MPKISRFLFGKWPNLDVHCNHNADNLGVTAAFQDWKGCRHRRTVEGKNNSIKVTDCISGFKERAVLRWRLAPELNWQSTENGCHSDLMEIRINGDNEFKSMRIEQGWESLYYMEKTEIPVLEIIVGSSCSKILSIIELK